MAIYHLHAKVIRRSAGQSAVACAAYRSGSKMLDERTGIYCDYSRKSGISHTEIIAPKNAPSWVYDRSKLWNKAERAENRKDSQLSREIEIALPVELSLEEQKELTQRFVSRQFVTRGMIADVALHDTGKGNPHAHIMLTMRPLDNKEFSTKKAREWNDKNLLENWREEWAKEVNKDLKNKGIDSRIDHRTLKAQGIDREPINTSMAVYQMQAKGKQLDRLQDIYTAKAIAADLEAMKSEYYLLQEQKAELEKEIHLEDLRQLEGEIMGYKDYRKDINKLRDSNDKLEKTKRHADRLADIHEENAFILETSIHHKSEPKDIKTELEKSKKAALVSDEIESIQKRQEVKAKKLEGKERQQFEQMKEDLEQDPTIWESKAPEPEPDSFFDSPPTPEEQEHLNKKLARRERMKEQDKGLER